MCLLYEVAEIIPAPVFEHKAILALEFRQEVTVIKHESVGTFHIHTDLIESRGLYLIQIPVH